MKYWLQESFHGPSQSLVNYLCNCFSVGKGAVYPFIKDKKILVNGQKINTSYRLKNNDEIIIKYPLSPDGQPTLKTYFYEEKNLSKYASIEHLLPSMIIYENDNFMVINKPINWATQDGTGSPHNLDDFLTFCAIEHYLVHRLDKDTSGILLVAKNRPWARILTKLMEQGAITKIYWAVTPYADMEKWNVSSYIHDGVPYVNDYEPNSKTIFTKIKDEGSDSWWEAQLMTGKKHQIRIHCKLAGIPIIGDRKYHGIMAHRLHLHSYKIKFFYEKEYEFIQTIEKF